MAAGERQRDGEACARDAEQDALGGRGLGIVDAVADDWGVQVADNGKTVWAELAVEVD